MSTGRTSPLVAQRQWPVSFTSSNIPSRTSPSTSTKSRPVSLIKILTCYSTSRTCSPVASTSNPPIGVTLESSFTKSSSSAVLNDNSSTEQVSPTRELQEADLTTDNTLTCEEQTTDTDMVTSGPCLVVNKTVLQRIIPKKVGTYVASLIGATLSRERMASHSYKGQKAKNGLTKAKLDPAYISSVIEHAKSVSYSNTPRQVIEEDLVKAIKFKLNNEEQAWKKQHESNKE